MEWKQEVERLEFIKAELTKRLGELDPEVAGLHDR